MNNKKLPPHIVIEDTKEVIWYMPSGHPTTLGIPTLTKKHYPDGYQASVITNPKKWQLLQLKNKV